MTNILLDETIYFYIHIQIGEKSDCFNVQSISVFTAQFILTLFMQEEIKSNHLIAFYWKNYLLINNICTFRGYKIKS